MFQHRFGAGAVRLREHGRGGRLGRPMLATCDTLWYRDDDYYAVPWRGRWDTEGGGPTMGHGIHQFDLLLSVLGPWEKVTAVAAPAGAAGRDRGRVDGPGHLRQRRRRDGGQLGAVAPAGVRAAVRLRARDGGTVAPYGYTDDDWTVHPAPGHEDVATRWSWAPSREESGHAGQLAAVLDALDAGEPLPVTPAETRQTMEFVAALYASAFTGTTVHSGQIGPDSPFAASMHGAGAPWAAVSVA